MLAVDPLFDIFRQLDPRETPASLGQILGQPSVLAILPTSSEDRAMVDRYRQLAEAWRSDEHKIEFTADAELENLPDDRAIWILGRKNLFAEKILSDASEVSVAKSWATLTLRGRPCRLPTIASLSCDVTRETGSRPSDGWWWTLPPRAAGLARKLPHYGKYSFLAFQGQEPTNVIKGQWKTGDSPLVVDLREIRGKR